MVSQKKVFFMMFLVVETCGNARKNGISLGLIAVDSTSKTLLPIM